LTKVSIITVNYNNAEGLKRTIGSVASQSYRNIQYIVIDGGSGDGSEELIRNNKDVSFWISEKDSGVFYAQNKGLKAANGDYVLVLNSGDELAGPDVLKKVFSTEQTDDILYGNMIIADAAGNKKAESMPSRITFEHMIKDTLWHPVSFVKLSFLKKVGFYDTDFKIAADYEWFLRAIFTFKATLKHLNLPVSVFYLGGMSSDPKNSIALEEERKKAQEKIFGIKEMLEYRAKEEKQSKNVFYRIWKRIKG
jgi:glycosyltransferase involved in cell wall biosynthesis